MKVNSVSAISFKGKIIDSHAHIGNWGKATYTPDSLDTFIKEPLANGDIIEKILVSNLSCIDATDMKDELSGNIEMLNAAKENPKIVPLAVCQPKTGSVDNIKKLFADKPHSFVGLKFHPDGHQIMADDTRFSPYLQFAQDKKLPCLFHSGLAQTSFSHPQKIYTAAQQIPKTPVILAHLGAGGPSAHKEAIDVLLDSIKTDKAKLYADISWVDIDKPEKPTIIELIKKLKSFEKDGKKIDYTDRLLFGSDAPIGEFDRGKDGLNGKQFYNKTVVDIKKAIQNNFGEEADKIIDKIFYQNAQELFFNNSIEEQKAAIQETAKATKKKLSKTKIGIIISSALLIGGAAISFIKNKNQTNKPTSFSQPNIDEITKRYGIK